MLSSITRLFGTKNARLLKKMMPLVKAVAGFEPAMQALTDDELCGKTLEFRERLAQGKTIDDLLPEAFAVVREASVRTMGMRHYDVQILGGVVLHRGCIAEMKTGEGKTLTATLALYLSALEGKGAWLVTVNDYLAKRDAEWMGKIYCFLGLTVGTILHEKTDKERYEAYRCDITYGTNNEFGFDYLRDNMKFNTGELSQRGFHYAIVDEVDSVLIDEARTPLIISGPTDDSTAKYFEANMVLKKLKPEHYSVDIKDHHALFNEEGIAECEKQLKVGNLYDPSNIEILHCLEQALRAHHLFRIDVDYMVENSQVVIVDQHTGRLMPGRRYSDGLHQALEAKEDVKIERQSQTMATVTFQNFFRMFTKLSGMTGTAETEAPEFLSIYKLECIVLPTNRPLIRVDANDLIYGTTRAKFNAILDTIKEEHSCERPVLVGTIAIETSEALSLHLTKAEVKHTVLNAKYHASEADIVAQAGRLGAVTIATNMAGRGTDIILGGNPEALTDAQMKAEPDGDREALLAKYTAECEKGKRIVLAVGGLCIIGTERHESRRIDNQLRGRSGRQGDPGRTQFYLSLEDNLMKRFGNEKIKSYLVRSMEDDTPIEHRLVSNAVERAQKAVEARNFDTRKQLLDYDDVLNKQRNTFYDMRRDLLFGNAGRASLFERASEISESFITDYEELQRPDKEEAKKLLDGLKAMFAYEPSQELAENWPLDTAALREGLMPEVTADYVKKWEKLGLPEEAVSDHERFIMLYVIDQQWKDHMRSMDFLKEGISLWSYAQKDPLIEYKKESFGMFHAMLDRMDEEVVKTLIHMQPQVKASEDSMKKMRTRRAEEARSMKRAGDEEQDQPSKTFRRGSRKIGRNEPCHCGSGKKFKQCHGRH